jgi:hyperpolarization activated cyclic nucleotide-gated potassium channel 2
VRRYLEYVWENQKNNFNENEILSLLSEPLRDEIYAHIHANIIRSCSVFIELYDVHFISQLSKTFDQETFAPGDVILEEGELSTVMYFVTSGTIDIYHDNTNSSFKELETGSYFGEIAFFTEKPRCASARCLDFVDLLSL